MAGSYTINADIRFKLNSANTKPVIDSLNKQLSSRGVNLPVNLKFKQVNVQDIQRQNAAFRSLTNTLTRLQTSSSKSAVALNQLHSTLRKMSGTLNGFGRTANFGGFQQQIANVNRQLGQTGNNFKKAQTEAIGFAESVGISARRFVSFGTAAAVLAKVSYDFRNAVTAAIEFDRQMVRLEQVSNDGEKSIAGIAKTISKLGIDLGVSSKEMAEAAVTLRQAGLSARDTQKALEVLGKTTLSPSFESLKSTTEGMIALFNQFKPSVDDLEKHFSALSKVSAEYAVESTDLVEALKRTGGAFKTAGGNVNELFAMFTTIRSSTRESAESIATGMRTILARLQDPAIAKKLHAIGVEVYDLKGKFVGPYEAVERLGEALRKLPQGDMRASQILKDIGGLRQLSRVIPLIYNNDETKKALATANSAGNKLSEDAAKAQKAIQVQLDRIKEGFLDLFRVIATDSSVRTVLNGIIYGVEGLTKALQTLKPLVPVFLAFAAVKTSQAIIGGIRPLYKGFTNPVRGYAKGGWVTGGTPGKDSVPAMLMPGEYVVPAKEAKHFARMSKYANGGFVDWSEGGWYRAEPHFQKMRSRYLKNLPPNLKQALLDYQTTPSINQRLIKNPNDNHPWIPLLSEAVNHGKTKVGQIVYRGIGQNEPFHQAKKLGDLIHVPNFLSTSPSPYSARQFGNSLISIHLPKGTNAAYLPKMSSQDEMEMLLQKGQNFAYAGRYWDQQHRREIRHFNLYANGGVVAPTEEHTPYQRDALGGIIESAQKFGLSHGETKALQRLKHASERKNRLIEKYGYDNAEEILHDFNYYKEQSKSGPHGLGQTVKFASGNIHTWRNAQRKSYKRGTKYDLRALRLEQMGIPASHSNITNYLDIIKSRRAYQINTATGSDDVTGTYSKSVNATMVKPDTVDLRQATAAMSAHPAFWQKMMSRVQRTFSKKFSTGGFVPTVQSNIREGTDSVPTLLTPGEFVIRKAAAQKIGYDKLSRLNSSGNIAKVFAKHAHGGVVGQGLTMDLLQDYLDKAGINLKAKDFISNVVYDEKLPKGRRGEYNPNTRAITVGPRANLGTLLHEFGHSLHNENEHKATTKRYMKIPGVYEKSLYGNGGLKKYAEEAHHREAFANSFATYALSKGLTKGELQKHFPVLNEKMQEQDVRNLVNSMAQQVHRIVKNTPSTSNSVAAQIISPSSTSPTTPKPWPAPAVSPSFPIDTGDGFVPFNPYNSPAYGRKGPSAQDISSKLPIVPSGSYSPVPLINSSTPPSSLINAKPTPQQDSGIQLVTNKKPQSTYMPLAGPLDLHPAPNSGLRPKQLTPSDISPQHRSLPGFNAGALKNLFAQGSLDESGSLVPGYKRGAYGNIMGLPPLPPEISKTPQVKSRSTWQRYVRAEQLRNERFRKHFPDIDMSKGILDDENVKAHKSAFVVSSSGEVTRPENYRTIGFSAGEMKQGEKLYNFAQHETEEKNDRHIKSSIIKTEADKIAAARKQYGIVDFDVNNLKKNTNKLFKYKGVDREGNKVSGMMEAPHIGQVNQNLKRQGISVSKVSRSLLGEIRSATIGLSEVDKATQGWLKKLFKVAKKTTAEVNSVKLPTVHSGEVGSYSQHKQAQRAERSYRMSMGLGIAGMMAPMATDYIFGTVRNPGRGGMRAAKTGSILGSAIMGGAEATAVAAQLPFGQNPYVLAGAATLGTVTGAISGKRRHQEDLKDYSMEKMSEVLSKVNFDDKKGGFATAGDAEMFGHATNQLIPYSTAQEVRGDNIGYFGSIKESWKDSGFAAAMGSAVGYHAGAGSINPAYGNELVQGLDEERKKTLSDQALTLYKQIAEKNPTKSHEEILKIGQQGYDHNQYNIKFSSALSANSDNLKSALNTTAALNKTAQPLKTFAAMLEHSNHEFGVAISELDRFTQRMRVGGEQFAKRQHYSEMSSAPLQGQLMASPNDINLGSLGGPTTLAGQLHAFSKEGGGFDKSRQELLSIIQDEGKKNLMSLKPGEAEENDTRLATRVGERFGKSGVAGTYSSQIAEHIKGNLGGIPNLQKKLETDPQSVVDSLLDKYRPLQQHGQEATRQLQETYGMDQQRQVELMNRKFGLRQQRSEHAQQVGEYFSGIEQLKEHQIDDTMFHTENVTRVRGNGSARTEALARMLRGGERISQNGRRYLRRTGAVVETDRSFVSPEERALQMSAANHQAAFESQRSQFQGSNLSVDQLKDYYGRSENKLDRLKAQRNLISNGPTEADLKPFRDQINALLQKQQKTGISQETKIQSVERKRDALYNMGGADNLRKLDQEILKTQDTMRDYNEQLKLLANNTHSLEDAQKAYELAQKRVTADVESHTKDADVMAFGSRGEKMNLMMRENITQQALSMGQDQFSSLPDQIKKIVYERLNETQGMNRQVERYDKYGRYQGVTNVTGEEALQHFRQPYLNYMLRDNPSMSLLNQRGKAFYNLQQAGLNKFKASEAQMGLQENAVNKQSLQSTENFQAFLKGINDSIATQMEATNKFLQGSAELTKALNSFKDAKLQIERNGRVEVVINGANTISALKGDLETEIMNTIVEKLQGEIQKAVRNVPAR